MPERTRNSRMFDAKGNVLVASVVSNPIRFTGRRVDVETGLQFSRARYYSVDLGRWIGRDPIGYRDGLSLYQYVSGSPLNKFDPTGLSSSSPSLKVTVPIHGTTPPFKYHMHAGGPEMELPGDEVSGTVSAIVSYECDCKKIKDGDVLVGGWTLEGIDTGVFFLDIFSGKVTLPPMPYGIISVTHEYKIDASTGKRVSSRDGSHMDIAVSIELYQEVYFNAQIPFILTSPDLKWRRNSVSVQPTPIFHPSLPPAMMF